MTKEEIRDKALKYISERASGTSEEMNYYAEILTEFVVEKIIVDIKQQAYQKGAEFGYNKAFVEADKNLKAIVTDFNKANEWHNLQENPTDLPKCEENEQIIFYVKEWIESIQKYRTHYCLGFYKKSFLIEGVKVFGIIPLYTLS